MKRNRGMRSGGRGAGAMWTIGDNRQRTCGGISRRGFLQIGCLGALGVGLPELVNAQAASRTARMGGGPKQKAVILLWLWGGPSQLDTFDPKPEAPLDYRGPFRAIGTNVPGIQVCEYLPQLA